jgi:hypothetical protein
MKMIRMISYNQKTQVTMEIMTACFSSMFINTALIQVIASANFRNTILWFIPIRNHYNDFVSDWYVVIGSSLQTTMLVTAFMPYLMCIISFSLKQLSIFKDRGYQFSNKLATNMLTI